MRSAFLTILRVNAFLSLIVALYLAMAPIFARVKPEGSILFINLVIYSLMGALAFIVWSGVAEWAKATFEIHDQVCQTKPVEAPVTVPMINEALAKLKEIQASVDDPTDIKQIIESQAQLDRLTNGLADVLGEIITRLQTIEGKLNKPG